ncbi:IucC family-domain-containing protein [Gongronella butleri]|nr:IucC family-domain-containing protein [Gongronella butleri]
MPVASSVEKNAHFAKFATTSRFISCLVSERLTRALFVPNKNADQDVRGLCIVLQPGKVSLEQAQDILVVVPLRGVPMLEPVSSSVAGAPFVVSLVDGWDMLPHIYDVASQPPASYPPVSQAEATAKASESILASLVGDGAYLIDGLDAVQLWTRFATRMDVNDKLIQQIAGELDSSMIHQAAAYNHPKVLPTLQSSSVAWEQSILEGHATHPMHKARKSFPPMKPLVPGENDLENPTLRLVAIPIESATLRGDYHKHAQGWIDLLMTRDKQAAWTSSHVLMPVHELQLPNITERFADVHVFDAAGHSVSVQSLTSIRSIAAPELVPGQSLKLCLGIKVSSALRTITPFSTHFGPGFSEDVVPRLTYDKNVLSIERELASAVYKHDDTDVAKHCSCVVREAFEYEAGADAIIPCAALVEKIQQPDTHVALVEHTLGLDTYEKRVAFLDRYVDLLLQAFLPPVLVNGVAFEAHGQNTLARFDRATGELKGFVVRDFGGVKVHRETLRNSCNVDIDVLPESCVVAETKDEVYKLLYHTVFHCHLQRLVRVLDLHYSGEGWRLVRKHLTRLVPQDHELWNVLMEQEKVPGKCMIRMKMEELYRDYIYEPVPNVILFKPTAAV